MRFLEAEPSAASAVFICKGALDFASSDQAAAISLAKTPKCVSERISEVAQSAVKKIPEIFQQIDDDPELMYSFDGAPWEESGCVWIPYKVWAPPRRAP